MPHSELVDPEDRTATGVKVRYLYCDDCGRYSGGGVCRMCEEGVGEFTPPVPPAVAARVDSVEPFVAIVCSRGGGCEVVELPASSWAAPARSMISATGAAGTPGPDTTTTRKETLL